MRNPLKAKPLTKNNGVAPYLFPDSPVGGSEKEAPESPTNTTYAATTAPQNPRKISTGTSYVASGIAPPQPNDTEIGSSQPVVIREVVPELVSPYQRLQVYTKMLTDASVDVSMRVSKTPVLGADFYVDPYSTQPIDQEIAEFIDSNLHDGLTVPMSHVLEDVLKMYEDGYSVLEKVHEMREWSPQRKASNTRQFTMLKKLAVRPASTITKINYDNNGGPLSVEQNALQADGSVNQITLDIANIVIFTFGRNGGDLTGKSLLRTAYSHWYYKTHLYKIDAIQKERHSLGIPKGKLLPGFTQASKEAMRTLLRNLRTNEEAFMLLPPNVDVEIAFPTGHPVEVLQSANHHNLMILLNVLAQFTALGLESSGGGRATAGAQVDMFMKAFRYVANVICDMFNMYVIPELVVWNYPTRNFPTLKVRNIGETRDLQMLAAALANLFAQGGLTTDDPTEDWIRQVFDMPKLTTQRPTTPQATTTSPNSPVGGAKQGPPNQQNKPPQKGNVGGNGGQGNTGKPPNAAQ